MLTGLRSYAHKFGGSRALGEISLNLFGMPDSEFLHSVLAVLRLLNSGVVDIQITAKRLHPESLNELKNLLQQHAINSAMSTLTDAETAPSQEKLQVQYNSEKPSPR
jgi:hypothetical protein